MRIYKYILPRFSAGVYFKEMPVGAKIISCGVQGVQIVLWAEVDPEADSQEVKKIILRPTGQDFDKEENEVFIGTVGIGIHVPFGIHVYEGK